MNNDSFSKIVFTPSLSVITELMVRSAKTAAEENRNPVIDAMEAKMDGISPEDRDVFERVLTGFDLGTVPNCISIEVLHRKEPGDERNASSSAGPAPRKKEKPVEADISQAG